MKSPNEPLTMRVDVSSRIPPIFVWITLMGFVAWSVPFLSADTYAPIIAIESTAIWPNNPIRSSAPIYPSPILPDYAIGMARERARDSLRLFDLSLSDAQIAKNHSAFQAIPVQYQPKREWKRTHYPDISILGLHKAGTSHLYQVIASHPQVQQFSPWKEFDFNMKHSKLSSSLDNKELLQKFMYQANEVMDKNISKYNGKKMTLNGHLSPKPGLLQAQYLQRSNIGKCIVLLRDPADWLWATYNFWVFRSHEDALPATKADWASAPSQYRSPELFHEYMLAGERSWTGNDLLAMRNTSRVLLTLLLNSTTKDNILVLKSEDFDPKIVKSSGVIQKLETFLNVSKDQFDNQTVYSYGNCGDLKGERQRCSKRTNAYAITGKRPMFEETRDLVYLHFAEECKFWAEQFGIYYTRCLEVRKRYIEMK